MQTKWYSKGKELKNEFFYIKKYMLEDKGNWKYWCNLKMGLWAILFLGFCYLDMELMF